MELYMSDESLMSRREGLGEHGGVGDLTPEQGLEALGQVLGLDETQVVVVNVDWVQLLGSFPPGRQPSILSELSEQEEDRIGAI